MADCGVSSNPMMDTSSGTHSPRSRTASIAPMAMSSLDAKMALGGLDRASIPMRQAMNEVLRDWYVGDCQAGVDRWNKILERHGLTDRLRLPDRKFNREIGMFSNAHFDPGGTRLSDEEWARRKDEWLPAPRDRDYLLSIMATPVYEPGVYANYIAPPARGINRQPVDFEYVRTEL